MSGFDGNAPTCYLYCNWKRFCRPCWLLLTRTGRHMIMFALGLLPQLGTSFLSAEGGVFYTDQQFHPIGASEDGVSLTHTQALQQFGEFIKTYQESGGRLLYL